MQGNAHYSDRIVVILNSTGLDRVQGPEDTSEARGARRENSHGMDCETSYLHWHIDGDSEQLQL